MAQTVVLLHQQHAKPDHFDWLIERPGINHEHRLVAFRVAIRPDQNTSFIAEKAPDHRAFYLDYEGPLTQNRGVVTRVAEGRVHDLRLSPDQLICRIDWDGTEQACEGVRIPDTPASWQFQLRPSHTD